MVDEKLLNKISSLLKSKKLSIATAESCTGGLIANSLTDIAGSSNYFERGIVSYSNEAKMQLLDVPEKLLIDYGAVSSQVAEAMAIAVRKNSKVDIGLSTTGIAGPEGGTKEKPVGLVYIAISTKTGVKSKKCLFDGNRLENKNSTLNEALKMLLESIEE